ncbi:hypothetical protein [Streptomyces sp. YIM 130001]|uniref:hypothetical protein n=1 Tax=Streptomyces sp. YIM 130001 TaxID=2259644 RepID=UPI0019690C33|nr:hypothetical protein [Streptomyces sp. YIM 130001]
MTLRRATAIAAATAVMAPAALLAAPSAYATEGSSPTPTPSVSDSSPGTTASPTPSETRSSTPPEEPGGSETATATAEPSVTDSTDPEPGASESESGEPSQEPTDPGECADSKVDLDIKGLPGKIATGSGWHKFSLTAGNESQTVLEDIVFLAGASADKDGEDVFKSKQVEIQAYNPDDRTWETVGTDDYAVGFVGWTDELKPGHTVDIPMRLNARAGAPVGSGFSLGASVYLDESGDCAGFGEVAYKFRIVAAGSDTEGTKPQEGGRAPVTDETPSKPVVTEVTGNLARTGSSSMLPTIGLIGGIAVLAGAGVVFAVRRRGAGEPPA